MIPATIKPNITLDDMDKIDIRVRTNLEVNNVHRSRKLVRLMVDFGDHQRTILPGIRNERTDPTEIAGRQALFVVNLESRDMAGETSHGMLLDIGCSDGTTRVLAVPEGEVPDGAMAG